MSSAVRYAMGAALASVIATSSGAGAAYLRDGISNMRAGMFLCMATTLGAPLEESLYAGLGNEWFVVATRARLLTLNKFLGEKKVADLTQTSATEAGIEINGEGDDESAQERAPEAVAG